MDAHPICPHHLRLLYADPPFLRQSVVLRSLKVNLKFRPPRGLHRAVLLLHDYTLKSFLAQHEAACLRDLSPFIFAAFRYPPSSDISNAGVRVFDYLLPLSDARSGTNVGRRTLSLPSWSYEWQGARSRHNLADVAARLPSSLSSPTLARQALASAPAGFYEGTRRQTVWNRQGTPISPVPAPP
ncbi:hypothetical protein SCHPADRAFT_943695 [Schizopora paradoxa]|uniref:Uncharacterized protein n=1 Tax=Schizopora paradoxa TaxID=27342 RepID=A0A0H2RBU3_9AGAM|nr:hypothetical protein SCHPADRAFT_943695 [Schizopora paradoxa]